MTSLTILLVAAAAAYGVGRLLGIPVIPLLMLAGIALSVFGASPEPEFTKAALELGLMFLVFASGIELNPKRFSRRTGAVVIIGLLQFTLTGAAGYALARFFDFQFLSALYVAFALATSSTLVALRELRRRQQLFEPFGRLVTGVLLLQDLLMIGIIVVLARVPEGFPGVASGIGAFCLLLGIALICHRWVLPLLIARMKLDEETLLLCVIAVPFLFGASAYFLGIPVIAGAFLAGFSLSAFPVNGIVRGLISSLQDFFGAIFFTALGAIVQIPDVSALLPGLAFALLVLILTPLLVTAIAEWRGIPSRSAIESGLLLAQTSELSIVLGLSGLLANHLSSEVFSTIALVTVVTMSLTPFLATDRITDRLLKLHPMRRVPEKPSSHRGHVLLLGFGANGMWVVKPLRENGHQILVVDDDPIVINELQRAGIPWIRGDGSDEKVLEKAGARAAKLIIAGMRRPQSAERVLRYVRGTPVVVRTFEAADAERIAELGGTPILNSAAAADAFMDWFDAAGHRPKIPVEVGREES